MGSLAGAAKSTANAGNTTEYEADKKMFSGTVRPVFKRLMANASTA
jgi:hypothetical protein